MPRIANLTPTSAAPGATLSSPQAGSFSVLQHNMHLHDKRSIPTTLNATQASGPSPTVWGVGHLPPAEAYLLGYLEASAKVQLY